MKNLILMAALSSFVKPSLANISAPNELSLQRAIAIAQHSDPWQHSNRLKQQATQDLSVAANQLPDPVVSLGLMNLPTGAWDLSQEGMSQIKLGVSQNAASRR